MSGENAFDEFEAFAVRMRDHGAVHVSAGGFSVQFGPRPIALPSPPAEPQPEQRAVRNLTRNRDNASDDDFTAEEREYFEPGE